MRSTLLTKSFTHGGFNLGRVSSSLVIAIFIVGCLLAGVLFGNVFLVVPRRIAQERVP